MISKNFQKTLSKINFGACESNTVIQLVNIPILTAGE